MCMCVLCDQSPDQSRAAGLPCLRGLLLLCRYLSGGIARAYCFGSDRVEDAKFPQLSTGRPKEKGLTSTTLERTIDALDSLASPPPQAN